MQQALGLRAIPADAREARPDPVTIGLGLGAPHCRRKLGKYADGVVRDPWQAQHSRCSPSKLPDEIKIVKLGKYIVVHDVERLTTNSRLGRTENESIDCIIDKRKRQRNATIAKENRPLRTDHLANVCGKYVRPYTAHETEADHHALHFPAGIGREDRLFAARLCPRVVAKKA